MWTVADLGWMYYESYLHVPPPRNSFFHFMVDGRSLLLATALLLDQTEESPWYFFDPVSVLDTVQLFIVFLLIYLGWYHVPSLHGSLALSMVRSDQIEISETCAVIAIAFLQVLRDRTSELRSLYIGFLVCFVPLAIGIAITDL